MPTPEVEVALIRVGTAGSVALGLSAVTVVSLVTQVMAGTAWVVKLAMQVKEGRLATLVLPAMEVKQEQVETRRPRLLGAKA